MKTEEDFKEYEKIYPTLPWDKTMCDFFREFLEKYPNLKWRKRLNPFLVDLINGKENMEKAEKDFWI